MEGVCHHFATHSDRDMVMICSVKLKYAACHIKVNQHSTINMVKNHPDHLNYLPSCCAEIGFPPG